MTACWGPESAKHVHACRPGRPLCRWRRKLRGICSCDAYHFPHRTNGGNCGKPERIWALLDLPRRRAT
jgi:hypothetical protein